MLKVSLAEHGMIVESCLYLNIQFSQALLSLRLLGDFFLPEKLKRKKKKIPDDKKYTDLDTLITLSLKIPNFLHVLSFKFIKVLKPLLELFP